MVSGNPIAFNAKSRASVDSFYRIALENDGQGAGDPGLWIQYSERYYAAFVLDTDGNKIEAVYNDNNGQN